MNTTTNEDNNNTANHQPEYINDHQDKTNNNNNTNNTSSSSSSSSPLECNICYEDSYEPVVTTCGHMYCWACIYQWLQSKPENNYCPVCKNVITQEKLIPIYTKNDTQNNRRTKPNNIPKRPKNPREERQPNSGNQFYNNHFRGPAGNGLFNTLFDGFNINTPNIVVRIGFLPTLIPLIITIIFSFLGSSSYEEYHYINPSVGNNMDPRIISTRQPQVYDDQEDYFENTLIIFIFVFIALSCFVRRIMS